MGILLGTSFPPLPTRAVDTECGDPASADLFMKPARNWLLLHQWTDGNTFGGIPVAPLPYCGMDQTGHDHSGGIMGRPMQHLVWSEYFGGAESWLNTFVTGGRAPRSTQASTNNPDQIILDRHVDTLWVPGCSPDGAYVDAKLIADIYTAASPGTYQIRLKWDQDGAINSYTTGNISTAGFIQLTATYRAKLRPGFLQHTAHLTLSIASGSGTCTVTALSAALIQDKTSA